MVDIVRTLRLSRHLITVTSPFWRLMVSPVCNFCWITAFGFPTLSAREFPHILDIVTLSQVVLPQLEHYFMCVAFVFVFNSSFTLVNNNIEYKVITGKSSYNFIPYLWALDLMYCRKDNRPRNKTMASFKDRSFPGLNTLLQFAII